MKKLLLIIMGFLVGALVYGELVSNDDYGDESYLVRSSDTSIDEDDDMTSPVEWESCECCPEEGQECDNPRCSCDCHDRDEIEIED